MCLTLGLSFKTLAGPSLRLRVYVYVCVCVCDARLGVGARVRVRVRVFLVDRSINSSTNTLTSEGFSNLLTDPLDEWELFVRLCVCVCVYVCLTVGVGVVGSGLLTSEERLDEGADANKGLWY